MFLLNAPVWSSRTFDASGSKRGHNGVHHLPTSSHGASSISICRVSERALAGELGLRFRSGSSSPSVWRTAQCVARAMAPSSSTEAQVAPPTFQAAITNLQKYWAAQGCAIWLPHNTEVGAGTMNPATFLRVLGPEPWNVCYAEPSIRPDDSRYGDNPNRLQRHTQFQVGLLMRGTMRYPS